MLFSQQPILNGTRQIAFFFCFLALLFSCNEDVDTANKTSYLRHVGDTEFNEALDDKDFMVCNEKRVLQYYNFGQSIMYDGEKHAIMQAFENQFKSKEVREDHGYVIIRFIVNCEGETGWFRVQELDMDYQPKQFNQNIAESLLSITKNLDGWQKGFYDGKIYDYYQYLTFKIEHGKLIRIMP